MIIELQHWYDMKSAGLERWRRRTRNVKERLRSWWDAENTMEPCLGCRPDWPEIAGYFDHANFELMIVTRLTLGTAVFTRFLSILHRLLFVTRDE